MEFNIYATVGTLFCSLCLFIPKSMNPTTSPIPILRSREEKNAAQPVAKSNLQSLKIKLQEVNPLWNLWSLWFNTSNV